MTQHWTQSFFNKTYWEIFMKRSSQEIEHNYNIINKVIKINPESVLDVCCGVGDILNHFAQRGASKTLGLEYSNDYVDNRYIDTVIKADACEKNTDEKFDLVLNWFSSFAYFDKGKDRQMLENCFSATKKVFVLEIFNSYHILQNFKETLNYQKNIDGKIFDIKRDSSFNPLTRKLHQRWKYGNDGGFSEYNTSVNLYFVDEIVNLLKEVGFKDISISSYDGVNLSEFTINSPRLIFLAKR